MEVNFLEERELRPISWRAFRAPQLLSPGMVPRLRSQRRFFERRLRPSKVASVRATQIETKASAMAGRGGARNLGFWILARCDIPRPPRSTTPDAKPSAGHPPRSFNSLRRQGLSSVPPQFACDSPCALWGAGHRLAPRVTFSNTSDTERQALSSRLQRFEGPHGSSQWIGEGDIHKTPVDVILQEVQHSPGSLATSRLLPSPFVVMTAQAVLDGGSFFRKSFSAATPSSFPTARAAF